MKQLLAFLLFTLSFNVYSQSDSAVFQPYLKFDFKAGGYTLLALADEVDGNWFTRQYGDFFIDNIDTLESIKKEWIFREISFSSLVSFSDLYYVYIIKDGKVLDKRKVDLPTKQIFSDDKYEFDPNKIYNLQNAIQGVSRVEKSFDVANLNKGEAYSKKVSPDKNFIFMSRIPEYEGHFFINYSDKAISTADVENGRIEEIIYNQLNKKYSDKSYNISIRSISKVNNKPFALVEISSDKNFYDKFLEYNKQVWKYNSFKLVAYFKK